jgi:hypothetical protein
MGFWESCLLRITNMHCIKSITMFEDDVTGPEYALVMQGVLLGCLGWWRDVCNLKNVLPSLGCLNSLIMALPTSFLAR